MMINPFNSSILHEAGQLALELHQKTQDPSLLRQATEYFRKAVALSPNKVGPHLGLGLCLSSAERLDEALEQLEIAQLMHPYSRHVSAGSPPDRGPRKWSVISDQLAAAEPPGEVVREGVSGRPSVGARGFDGPLPGRFELRLFSGPCLIPAGGQRRPPRHVYILSRPWWSISPLTTTSPFLRSHRRGRRYG